MRAGYFLLGGRGVCWRGFCVLRAVRLGFTVDTTLRSHSIPSDAVGKASTDPSETRTKESTTCASRWAANPVAQ